MTADMKAMLTKKTEQNQVLTIFITYFPAVEIEFKY